jgi:hypothetical protein
MIKKIVFWVLAFLITAAAAIYQRKTGPTYELKTGFNYNGRNYEVELIRSHEIGEPCIVEVNIPPQDIKGELIYRKYPTNDPWTKVELSRKGDHLIGEMPVQGAAGKLEYYLVLQDGKIKIPEEGPVVIRFKGTVPDYILIPHIFFMFFAMMISTLAGIMALGKISKQKLYGKIAFILLLIGGMVLGPLVQKHAFGELWTGIPFGWDLTDNKTLIAVLFWFLAYIGNLKKERRGLTILAAVVLLAIFSIPHSMFGSELNPETGEIISAMIMPFAFF